MTKYIRERAGTIEMMYSEKPLKKGEELIFDTNERIIKGTWKHPIEGKEVIKTHADIVEKGEKIDVMEITGSIADEREIKRHKQITKWNEPTRKHLVKKICANCGTVFEGRTNQIYCSERCRKTAQMRRWRAKNADTKEIGFGKHGQFFYVINKGVTKERGFIPADYCHNEKEMKEYVNTKIVPKYRDQIIKQIEEEGKR